jgi:hypothetical protein
MVTEQLSLCFPFWVATEAAWLGGKMCGTKKICGKEQKKPLDRDRPSHG